MMFLSLCSSSAMRCSRRRARLPLCSGFLLSILVYSFLVHPPTQPSIHLDSVARVRKLSTFKETSRFIHHVLGITLAQSKKMSFHSFHAKRANSLESRRQNAPTFSIVSSQVGFRMRWARHPWENCDSLFWC